MDEWFSAVGLGLAKLVILAFFIERALFFVFDYSRWRDKINGKGIRAPIALLFAWLVCWYYDFDVVAPLLSPEGETQIGVFITALIAAGGSAAAIKLFQDVLGFSRMASEESQKIRKAQREAQLAKAQSEAKIAVAQVAKAKADAAKATAEAKTAGA